MLTHYHLIYQRRSLWDERLIIRFLCWSLIIAVLLIPGGPILVTTAGLVLGVLGQIRKVNLFFLFFLTGFINGALVNFEGYAMLRYLLLVPLIINSRTVILLKKVLTVPIILFFIYLIGHSALISPDPIFSLLNVVAALLTIAAGFAAVHSDKKEDFWATLTVISVAVVFWSLVSIPFPDFSYARNGVGLQGIGTHPNLFAVFLAPMCFVSLARLIFRPTLIDTLCFGTLFITLILSQSRTSIFSVFLALVIYCFFAKDILRLYSKRLVLSFVPFVFIAVVFAAPISDFVLDVLTKGGGGAISFAESVERSRGALFLAQTQNIAENPLLGIGFKILSTGASNSFFEASSTENAYEKGVFLLALTEELGIFGAILFFTMLYSMLSHIIRREVRSPIFFISVCFLFTTFGEATLLSIGSNGPLIWASIAFSRNNYAAGKI
jgi:hypothetical protein